MVRTLISAAFMFGLFSGGTPSITSSGSWGSAGTPIVGTTSTITAIVKTITVPAGSSGVIALSIAYVGPGTMQYKKNAGSFLTFTNGALLTMTNADTLNFQITGSGTGSKAIGNVVDNVTAVVVGTVDIENTL